MLTCDACEFALTLWFFFCVCPWSFVSLAGSLTD